MTRVDYRFDEIVELQTMIGPQGKFGKAICKECSEVHKCTLDEFDSPRLVHLNGSPVNLAEPEHCHYVAQMRAWNCCHEGDKPLDKFPEEPPSLLDVDIRET
ncbi:MAG: hypothetical protein J07AB43_00360 [Candidatus Nanosalina sp. J07AB43]|nr:MAG: hypothetical protein J07AB43_00360 [Candidatus Nanosalina sp. J07AB43]